MTSIADLFKTPTFVTLALRELERAQREQLNICSTLEYTQAMLDYNTKRIRRLEEVLKRGNF
jgi:hypothetical protein